LEAWIAAKGEFLKANESVETLKEAQSKLKLTEAFVEEYKASESRLKQVKGTLLLVSHMSREILTALMTRSWR